MIIPNVYCNLGKPLKLANFSILQLYWLHMRTILISGQLQLWTHFSCSVGAC